ncbi:MULTISPECIES: lipopolysaccharide kinase InaA family protein [unclassified Lentimonas]|uniref:lipopolysaccharide kinase InaA family protein n=1 Tax=unclassified Lentimonas TaxID=2630993 RepID=UPI001323248A|nr:MULTISPECIES: lipopolysaccharide kinase InaA family protein [unclassified Lentimonas]CAA6692809.1 Unannotated [Lentimonas sp. CC10]CAA6695533.1 Unannotated [Lentimonas sp. CC19]CAA7069865.1 Unannotated [Lentimonas sp. CC11]
MPLDYLDHPEYRLRARPTRTRFGAWLWSELAQLKAPKGLGLLFRERVHIEPEYQQLMRSAGLDRVRSVFETKQGDLLTSQGIGGEDDVSRIRLDDKGNTRTFYVKRFWNRRLECILARVARGSLFGRSVMRAEFEKIQSLGKMGLRIPRVVGYGEQRFCGAVINTYMITEEIPDAMGVDFIVHKWMSDQPIEQQRALKDELLTSIASAVKTMHQNGFEHHDLFLRNLIITEQNMSNLYVFDCPRAYRWPAFIMKRRRKVDLAMLDAGATVAFSPVQRMRFLHQYLGCKRLSAEDKAFARDVLECAAPMRKKQLRRLKLSLPADS